MKIGSITLPVGAALAPMAGITDTTMRVLCSRMGCAWTVSEMLSAKGYVYNPEGRIHKELIARSPKETTGALQLFGCEEKWLSEAIKRLSDTSFAFFDFNMGCPAHKIVANGEGSALMLKPMLAGRLIESMVKASSKPVTVKIRAGWDKDKLNAVQIAKICEESGASAVTVHPRTREMFYSGCADWDVIASVKQALSIPVIGNGDIRNGKDALKMLSQTGCDGIMVARAAQGNVWIFDEIKCALEGRAYIPPTPEDRVNMALEHLKMQTEQLSEKLGVIEMRKHIAWYLQGLPQSGRLRSEVNRFTEVSMVYDALNEYKNTLKKEGYSDGTV